MPHAALPEPIAVDCRGLDPAAMLQREWLVANRLGAYASGTVLGANSRRYHGLLIAATLPPVGRQMMVSNLHEQLVVGSRRYDLSTFRFTDTYHPEGFRHLVRFVNDAGPTWEFRCGDCTVTKEVTMAENANVSAVRYRVEGPRSVKLLVRPFVALRDFHGTRQAGSDLFFAAAPGGVLVEDRLLHAPPVWLGWEGATFRSDAQWWHRFEHPTDMLRGQEGYEDLYSPGFFEHALEPGQAAQLTFACERTGPIDFDGTLAARQQRLERLVAGVGAPADRTTKRLAMAADPFLVVRDTRAGSSTSILAGYHWFADWGRDTFISLPGLTLLTGQLDRARQILLTFAEAIRDGMVPNRFDDYGGSPHYNSIDASMWFVHAVDRYIRTTGDTDAWRRDFMAPVGAILRAYHDGTHFDIHADADGLVAGGNRETQLTWMDAKFAGQAITPREGKAVEVNALYLEGLHIMAERCRGLDDKAADHFAAEAQRVGESFARSFWYAEGGYLYDCLGPNGPDASLRPNQAIAIAQRHCPLPIEQQRSALQRVAEQLLTPVGLRTLAPTDGRYCGSLGVTWESRDRAYHQGTVWPWLIGPFIQAYLKVNEFSDAARAQAARWLEPFDAHLEQAGLGSVSEIFAGDAPHAPAGCIAQAWSVAEVLRAKLMVQRGMIL